MNMRSFILAAGAAVAIAFPALAWVLTRPPRDHAARPDPVPSRWRGVLVYLAVFAVLVLGWGFSAINDAFPVEPVQSVVQVLVKLATMVVLPLWLFVRWRRMSPGPFGRRRLWLVFIVMSLAYLALQAVFGRGLSTLSELDPALATLLWAVPACLLWQSIEAAWRKRCCSAACCRSTCRSPPARTWPPSRGRRCCLAWRTPPGCGCAPDT